MGQAHVAGPVVAGPLQQQGGVLSCPEVPLATTWATSPPGHLSVSCPRLVLVSVMPAVQVGGGCLQGDILCPASLFQRLLQRLLYTCVLLMYTHTFVAGTSVAPITATQQASPPQGNTQAGKKRGE
jgi:hypothetical protein